MAAFFVLASPFALVYRLEVAGQLARVSERNIKARETGDITMAKWCSGVSRETTRFSVKSR